MLPPILNRPNNSTIGAKANFRAWGEVCMDHRNDPGSLRCARQRDLSATSRQLVLLAPSGAPAPDYFGRVQEDGDRHRRLIAEMQRLRGRIYLKDGAIDAGMLTHGRHQLPADRFSWHLLVFDRDGEICGCSRYREHRDDIQFSKLGVAKSALAGCPNWGHRMRSAVQSEITISRRLGYPYVEVGGWALTERVRRTTEALRMALSMYALGQALGGGVGISTATTRHGSSSILKGVGGRPLEDRHAQMPAYYDANYRCEMELLRFYSWAPAVRFAPLIPALKAHLRNIPVVTCPATLEPRPHDPQPIPFAPALQLGPLTVDSTVWES